MLHWLQETQSGRQGYVHRRPLCRWTMPINSIILMSTPQYRCSDFQTSFMNTSYNIWIELMECNSACNVCRGQTESDSWCCKPYNIENVWIFKCQGLTGDGQVGAFHPSLLHQVPDGLELRHNLILLFPGHRFHTEEEKKATAIYQQGTTVNYCISTICTSKYFSSIHWYII